LRLQSQPLVYSAAIFLLKFPKTAFSFDGASLINRVHQVGGGASPIGVAGIVQNIEIKLVFFPKIGYFLEQENG